MVIEAFPPVETADENGLVAIGGDLSVESLLLAYRSGIFPWPLNEKLLAWFSPPQRAILFFDDLTISRSLEKELRRNRFTVTFDKEFRKVIEACSSVKNRKSGQGTWITRDIIDSYVILHRAGWAHSIETHLDGALSGGLYGVAINGFFAGESMFYLEPNASKVAFVALVDYLRTRGVTWIDCQVMTPHLRKFGAREIARDRFLEMLTAALKMEVSLFSN